MNGNLEYIKLLQTQLIKWYNKKWPDVGDNMGIYKASTREIARALDNALDDVGDFTEKQLFDALEKMKLYPFVSDKKKSVPKYIEAGNKLDK